MCSLITDSVYAYIIVLLSSWAAGLVANTIFEPSSLEVGGDTIESANSDYTESEYENYFAAYTFAIAVVFAAMFMVCWKIFQCCTCSCLKKDGYIVVIRTSMTLKLTIMVLTPVVINQMENMEFKTKTELTTGVCLYLCELVSTLIEYHEVHGNKSNGGFRIWIKSYADFTSAQMIAAQLFKSDEYYMLAVSLVASTLAASYMLHRFLRKKQKKNQTTSGNTAATTSGNAEKTAEDAFEWYAKILIWVGLGAGLAEGLAILQADFKEPKEVVNFLFLFLLTLVLPAIKKKYHALELENRTESKYTETEEDGKENGQYFTAMTPV